MTEFPQHGWVLAFSGRYCWREQAQRRHHSKNTHVLPPARTQSKRNRRSKATLRARKWRGSVLAARTYPRLLRSLPIDVRPALLALDD